MERDHVERKAAGVAKDLVAKRERQIDTKERHFKYVCPCLCACLHDMCIHVCLNIMVSSILMM